MTDVLNAATAPVEIELSGRSFSMRYTFGALQVAKKELKKQGVEINLLSAFNLTDLDVDTLPVLLFAAIHTDAPELSFEDVAGFITMHNAGLAYNKVLETYVASITPPEKREKNEEAETTEV